MIPSLWMIYRSKTDNTIFTTACPDGDYQNFSAPEQLIGNDNDHATATTNNGCSAVAFQGALWIAYVEPGNCGYIYLARSTDGGVSFGANIYLGRDGKDFSSDVAPTLAVFEDKLWMFWRSRTSGEIMYSTLGSWNTDEITEPRQLLDHDTGAAALTKLAPAAMAFQGALWVAYVEPGTSGYIYFARTTDGESFSTGIYLGKDIVSSAGPALAVFDDRLWMAWRSKTDNTLFTSSVASWDTDQFTAPQQVVDSHGKSNPTTDVAPAIAAYAGSLWIAYLEPAGDGRLLFARSNDGGVSFEAGLDPGKDIVSSKAPALFGDAAISGGIRPKFQVLTILYAPPGQGSSVSYATAGSVGSTLSVSRNTNGSVSLSAEVEGDGNSVEAGVSQSVSASDSRDLTITKSESKSWDIEPEIPSDDIDHGNDIFKIVANPLVNVTSGSLNNMAWSLGTDGAPQPFDILLRWIHPTVDTTQKPIQELIDDFGFTSDDFDRLARCHPFCDSSVIDGERFTWISWATYEHGTGSSTTYSLKTEELKNYTCSKTTSLTVSCKLTAGFDVAGIGASVTQENEFTWEASSSNTTSSSNEQTASATIRSPSKDWDGGSAVYFYLDKIYNTFMFSFQDEPSSTKTQATMAAVSAS